MRTDRLCLVVLLVTAFGCRPDHTVDSVGELSVVERNPDGTGGMSRDATFDFGDIYFGHAATLPLEVRNTGRASISLTSLTVGSGDAEVSNAADAASTHTFRVQFAPVTIAPAGSVQFPIMVSRAQGDVDTEDLSSELTLSATGTEANQGTAAIHLRARAVKDGCASPQSLDFGVIGVDDSSSASISFPNFTRRGRAAPPPVLESETGDHLAFKVVSAPAQTDGGATRQVVVAFHPTESRDYSARLRMKAFDDCEERTIELHGTGAEDLLVWEPKLSFGFAPVGLSKTVSVTIRNIGPNEATLSNFSFKDDESFALAKMPAQPAVVPARGEAQLELTCSPLTVGKHQGAFDFESNLRQQPVGRITLTCFGGGPDIDVQPALLNFGKVAYVSSAATPLFQTRRISVINLGTASSAPPDPAEALHLGKSGAPPYFEVIPGPGTQSGEIEVALDGPYDPAKGIRGFAGQNMVPLLVKLSPASTGMKEADVVIYSSDLDEPEVKVHVLGNAVEYPPCRYSLIPATLAFGRVIPSSERDLEFKLTNLGQLPEEKCLVSALDFAPGSDAEFSLPDGPVASRDLLPGETMTVRVHAAPVGAVPTTPALVTSSIRFFINSPTSPEVSVPVSMEVGASCLATFPDHLDFGSVATGCGRSKSLELRNICSSDIYVTAASLRAGSPNFSIVSAPSIPSGGLLVRPGIDHPEFILRFAPQSIGKEQATFGVDVNETGKATSIANLIPLEGTAATTAFQTDAFTQGGGPVDILFNETTENCYVLTDMARVSQRMPTFLQYLLDAQVDFHFGVTTFENIGYCDAQTPSGSTCRTFFAAGTLYSGPTHPELFLTPTTPNLFQKAEDKVSVWCYGGNTSGTDESIAALTPPNSTGVNAGFLRTGARLAVVQYAWLYEYYGNAPIQSTASQYVQFLGVKGPQRKGDFVFSGFCGQAESSDPFYSVDWNQIFATDPASADMWTYWRYQWLAQATGGLLGNTSPHNHLVQETEDLAQTVSGFRKWFPLSVTPDLSAGSVSVKVNGLSWLPTNTQGDTVWSYDPTTNRVVFSSVLVAPPKAASVEISYPTACN